MLLRATLQTLSYLNSQTMFNFRPHLIVFSLICTITCGFLSSCSLEDETVDKIVIKAPPVEHSKEEAEFLKLTRECTIGDLQKANDAVSLYISTLPKNDIPPKARYLDTMPSFKPYFYQKANLTIEFDKCLQKAISSGNKEFSEFYITRASTISRMAQYFYSVDDKENGAYWVMRGLNLSGLKQGYYSLGRIFIRDNKTKEIGAQMLSESAKLGNTNSKELLTEASLFKDVFTLLEEE